MFSKRITLKTHNDRLLRESDQHFDYYHLNPLHTRIHIKHEKISFASRYFLSMMIYRHRLTDQSVLAKYTDRPTVNRLTLYEIPLEVVPCILPLLGQVHRFFISNN